MQWEHKDFLYSENILFALYIIIIVYMICICLNMIYLLYAF